MATMPTPTDTATPSAGYILNVPVNRREVLKHVAQEYGYRGYPVSQAVLRFPLRRGRLFPVFASLEDQHVTHVMNGRKGAPADTGRVKLHLTKWLELKRPLPFDAILATVPKPVRQHLSRALNAGGLLPPRSLFALVEAVIRLAPETKERLERFSASSAEALRRFTLEARQNLALQKEAVALSLSIAGQNRDELLQWTPRGGDVGSFLDGLPGAVVREDDMIVVDLGAVPGFRLDRSTHVASKVFHRDRDGATLTVVMANRTALESQTGADLIYVNETFGSFVFVQYKAMRREGDKTLFRWKDDPDDDLVKEIGRMDKLLAEIQKIADDGKKESFRLHGNPFFLKLCSKIVLDPEDSGLFPGMYLPLEYWKRFQRDPCSTGAKGGRVAGFENIGRRLSNSEFIPLVAGAWVGTTMPQSAILEALIREILSQQKTVTFAVERKPPDDPDGERVSDVDRLFGYELEQTDDEDLEPPLLA